MSLELFWAFFIASGAAALHIAWQHWAKQR